VRRVAPHSDQPLHFALKSEVIGQAQGGGTTFVSVRRQHGRNDFSLVLHVWPVEFTLSGLQRPTVLQHLGFGLSTCSFTGSGECYAREVTGDF